MNYEQFKKKVLDEFIGYLDPEFSGYVLRVNEVRKVNEKLTGVCVAPEDPPVAFAAPTFYIETMYKEYQNCGNFPVVMTNTARVISDALRGDKPTVPAFTARSLLDNVVLELIGVAGNEDLIRGLPHRDFLDMVIIYRRIVSFDEHGVMSFIIDNYIADHANITEEQLFKKAYANTKSLLTPICRDMRSVLNDLSDNVHVPQKRLKDEPEIMVLTNDHRYLGATALLYPEVFEEIAEDTDSDLVILPSSVHDLIVLTDAEALDRESLCAMVDDVNRNHMSQSQILSYNVYGYKKGDMKISYYDRLVQEVAG